MRPPPVVQADRDRTLPAVLRQAAEAAGTMLESFVLRLALAFACGQKR